MWAMGTVKVVDRDEMAETVKKSRIDDLKNEDDDEEEEDKEVKNSIYENVEAVKMTQVSKEFIESEIEHYYEEPNDRLENIYENVAQTNNKTETNDQYPEIAVSDSVSPLSDQNDNKSVKDRMFLSTDDASCLLFTQTVTSPMLTPSEENIDFLKGFRRESSETNNSDGSPKNGTDADVSISEQIVTDLDEVKENIYENIPNGKVPEENIKEEPLYQNIEEVKAEADLNRNRDSLREFEKLEKDFESLVNLGVSVEKPDEEEQQESPEIIVETIVEHQESHQETHKEHHDTITEHQEKIVKSEVKEKYSEFIHHNKIETSQNYLEKYSEVVSKNTRNIENKEKDTETVPEKIVQNLKSQFSKSGSESSVKKEVTEVTKLKNIDIMKQINKFEGQKKEDDDSTVTETYSETTTIEEMGQLGDKGMKKKKSKKSRKEEKENISVNDDGENFYNVNVKSLCRSFGDLTKIDESFITTRKNRANERGRTKSLNDVTLDHKKIENVFSGVCVSALRDKFNIPGDLKSSFNKFDALQKKNVLHVRSSDAAGAQDKFNGSQLDTSNCKACAKTVFQMEQIKAEKAIWHKNCFRCMECSKQLNVDTYQSHEGNLYCKPHFKSLFAPKVVEEDQNAPKSKRNELIIRENQPLELPPDVVRASDKPDLGLEELHSLNVKERFQVFEQHQQESFESDSREPINVKRSPSILSKLARFQAKGMDVGVADDSLNGIPIEESASEEEEEEEIDGEDADLVRAKKVQKEKPFHFTGMSDVKNKWEKGDQNGRDERREERKQEIQSIRNRLFMGKQGKMKEMYQQAVMESENTSKSKISEKIDFDAKSIKDKFEKGELVNERDQRERTEEEEEVYESEISKKSRSLFLELDANASKPPSISPVTPPRVEIKKAREAYLTRVASEDTVKSGEVMDDVEVRTADIQERFKFFETYREPEKSKKQFRITPPREGQVKAPTPEREVYRDPDVVRSEEFVEDSVVAKESHTATKMLNKFRQMEENLSRDSTPQGPKPLKRFTPPPEPTRPESSSEGDSGSEEESEEDDLDNSKLPSDLLEAQKAARAKQLRAKFEKWEAQEIRREQTNVIEEYGDEQSQVESTKSLRARFENMREGGGETRTQPRVKVNRFVEISNQHDVCQSCKGKVYPLEKISVHSQIFHKQCFKCMECNCVLRMDSYTYNQGLLYCIPHFKRLFIAKGNYESGFGLDQHKDKWSPSPNTATMA